MSRPCPVSGCAITMDHWHEPHQVIVPSLRSRIAGMKSGRGRYLSAYEEGREDALNDVLDLLRLPSNSAGSTSPSNHDDSGRRPILESEN